MRNKVTAILTMLLLAGTPALTQAQQDTVAVVDLSFEELMNVKIVSASKRSENLFDAPLSASVLSKEEIQRAGATSIMEALRLVPGVIVRQFTNGNYDIHIRGLDNVPPNSLKLSSTNTTTLVMINDRPVYNYLQGGIFWEALPIDLNDVEKIEVIRGSSSTLYGPNAVSGVINIITNKIEKQGVQAAANVQRGSQNTTIANTSIGYRFNKKLNGILSGNYQLRGRDLLYKDVVKKKWYTTIDSLSTLNPSAEYPHPDRSMMKFGANGFIQYKPAEQMEFNFSTGVQKAETQTSIFDSFSSNLNTFRSTSSYVDLHAKTYRLTTHVSFNAGNQHTVVGFKSSMDFRAVDASAEYEVNIGKLAIKPGVAYRSAIYDDTKHSDVSKKEGTLNGRRYMDTYGATLRGEYSFWREKIRLTGGIRADKFTHPNDWFFSYQAAASLKVNPSNIFRAVFSKSYRSPFIYDMYQDLELVFPLGTVPEMYVVNKLSGNQQLKPLNSTMFEVGYRSKISSHVSLDVEAYSTRTNDFTSILTTGATIDTPQNFPFVAVFTTQAMNTPLWVGQLGTSVSVNFVFKKWQVRPFVTLQKTTLHDYSTFTNTPDVTPAPPNNFDPVTFNINSGIGTETDHKFTPKTYGGVYVNYRFGKFNVNMNSYSFSKQTFYHIENTFATDGSGIGEIKAKTIVNTKISYSPLSKIFIFVTAQNILNRQSMEYYLSDPTPRMIYGGVTLKL